MGYSKNDLNTPLFPNFQKVGLRFDATWEPNLWGKFHRNILAEDAALLASIADDAAANLARQQDSQASIERLVVSNLIGADKVLGGGWELRLIRDFIPKATGEKMQHRTNLGNIPESPDDSFTTDAGFEWPADTDETYLAPHTEARTGRGREGGE